VILIILLGTFQDWGVGGRYLTNKNICAKITAVVFFGTLPKKYPKCFPTGRRQAGISQSGGLGGWLSAGCLFLD
jgi:hypothetical protein